MAKLIIKLINSVADVVALTDVWSFEGGVENYSVSLGQLTRQLISQEISTAGRSLQQVT